MGKNIAFIGAGSWGTALAVHLATKDCECRMWDADAAHLASLRDNRENLKYLPGVKLPDAIHICMEEPEIFEGADVVVFSVPAQHFASAFEKALGYLPKDAVIVNVAKGIDQKTLRRMSEIAFDIKPDARYVVLSGPSHAEEVIVGLPTVVAVAARERALAEQIQEIFMDERLRIYTNDDIIGVELGGSLKNIIALGAGISDGLGYGDNAKAALMTRGITEMRRMGIKLGADPKTFSGLSGVGDLIVTCCSMHSRNRRCGILIGQGMDPRQAVKEVGMVVEGIYTADSAYRLAQKIGIEMPITEAIYNTINGKISAKDAVAQLMGRSRRHENDIII